MRLLVFTGMVFLYCSLALAEPVDNGVESTLPQPELATKFLNECLRKNKDVIHLTGLASLDVMGIYGVDDIPEGITPALVIQAMNEHPNKVVKVYGNIGELRALALNDNEPLTKIAISAKERLNDILKLYLSGNKQAIPAAVVMLNIVPMENDDRDKLTMHVVRELLENGKLNEKLFMKFAFLMSSNTMQEGTIRQEWVTILDDISEDYKEKSKPVPAFLQKLVHNQKMLGAQTSQVDVPWDKVELLLKAEDRIAEVLVYNDYALLVCTGFDQEGIYSKLITVPFDTAKKPTKRRINVEIDWSGRRCSSSDKQNCYVATQSGLVILPLDGSSPKILNEESGLPGNKVEFVAPIGDNIILNVHNEGSNLLLYNIHTGEIKMLASTLRREKKNILDSEEFAIEYCSLDTDGKGVRLWTRKFRIRQNGRYLYMQKKLFRYDFESGNAVEMKYTNPLENDTVYRSKQVFSDREIQVGDDKWSSKWLNRGGPETYPFRIEKPDGTIVFLPPVIEEFDRITPVAVVDSGNAVLVISSLINVRSSGFKRLLLLHLKDDVKKDIEKHRLKQTEDITIKEKSASKEELNNLNDKGNANNKTARIEDVNHTVERVAIIDATLQENSLSTQFRDMLLKELSNKQEVQFVKYASFDSKVTKEALSAVSLYSSTLQDYKDLGQVCSNANAVIAIEFLEKSKSQINDKYAAIRIQMFDCRYGFKVADRVLYVSKSKSELHKVIKDLATIYSNKISKLDKFSESTKLVKFNRTTTDEKSKNKRWIGWAAELYLDTLYSENIDCLVLERDRMGASWVDNLIGDKVPAVFIDSMLTLDIRVAYQKNDKGKYYYTLILNSLNGKGNISYTMPFFKGINLTSKASGMARYLKLKDNITESINAEIRLMATQAKYFEKVGEYDKALAIAEVLLAFDPNSYLYKLQRDKLYKDFSQKEDLNNLNDKEETNNKIARTEEVNREIKKVAIIDATIHEDSQSTQFRDMLLTELSNTNGIQIVTQASIEDSLSKDALSALSGIYLDSTNYQKLGELCNADAIIFIDFLANDKTAITNAYAGIRFQLIDCRYGLKVTDIVMHLPKDKFELEKFVKDLGIIYSNKINKLCDLSKLEKIVWYEKIRKYCNAKEVNWLLWSAPLYYDALYLDDPNYLLIEQDRMIFTEDIKWALEAQKKFHARFPEKLRKKVDSLSFYIKQKKTTIGEDYTLYIPAYSDKYIGKSIKILLYDVPSISKNFYNRQRIIQNRDVKEVGQAKTRLMCIQADYFKQTKEYNKELAILKALVELEPQNSTYQERYTKLYEHIIPEEMRRKPLPEKQVQKNDSKEIINAEKTLAQTPAEVKKVTQLPVVGIEKIAVIDATLKENDSSTRFRDYLIAGLSNTNRLQFVKYEAVDDKVVGEALSDLSRDSSTLKNYKGLGQTCSNANAILTIEFLENSRSQITNKYVPIRIQFFDCRYGLKVTDRVLYVPLEKSEQKAIAKDLAIIYSSKINKLNKFPESIKLIEFDKTTTDEKSENKRWIGWAAESYLDILYLENLDSLVLERDRMVVSETDNQVKDKFPEILIDSVFPVSINMCYRKAANGKYYYTLNMKLSKRASSRGSFFPLIFGVNFVSKSSSVAKQAKLKTNVTKSIKAKMRLMDSQATYFEQTKEYEKALSLFEALVALDPKNSTYKERRDKLYKDFSSKKEE